MTNSLSSSKQLRVGYVPYTASLDHPADRRRIAGWAKCRNIELVVDRPLDSDLLVLSNSSNFDYWIKRASQPIILDLVDGYLGENPSLLKDILRNILRTFNRTSSIKWISYTRHLRSACQRSSAIVVASPEQRELALQFNSNVFVISDDHFEIDLLKEHGNNDVEHDQRTFIFWEGFGFTLKHFDAIAKVLDTFLNNNNLGMFLVTTKVFPRWGGFLGKVETRKIIRKYFPRSHNQIEIVEWSLDNLVKYANRSKFAIIPVNLNDHFAIYKSENKLLSMWHLGLATLCSDIPAYRRVASQAFQNDICLSGADWESALERFFSDSRLLREMQKRSREFLNANHSHEQILSKWDLVLLNTLEDFEPSM